MELRHCSNMQMRCPELHNIISLRTNWLVLCKTNIIHSNLSLLNLCLSPGSSKICYCPQQFFFLFKEGNCFFFFFLFSDQKQTLQPKTRREILRAQTSTKDNSLYVSVFFQRRHRISALAMIYCRLPDSKTYVRGQTFAKPKCYIMQCWEKWN